MKSILLFSLVLIGLIAFNSCYRNNSSANYFEGSISYKFEVFPSKDSDNFFKQLGRSMILSFKDGNFFHKYEGSIYATDLYNKEENKMYLKKVDSDITLVVDCSLSGSQIISLTLNPKKETILGILCDELIIQYKEKTVIDYFNSDTLTINPKWFQNFNFDEEYRIDKKEKSIFLKRKILYPEYTVTQTATSISPGSVDSKLFTVPEK